MIARVPLTTWWPWHASGAWVKSTGQNPRVPAFEVVLSGPHDGPVSGYERWEDLRTGEVGTAWERPGGTVRHRTFVSRAHGLGVLEILTARPATYRLCMRRAFASHDGKEQAVAEDTAYPELAGIGAGLVRYVTLFKNRWPGAVRGVIGALRAVSDIDVTGDGCSLLLAGATRTLVLVGQSPTMMTMTARSPSAASGANWKL